MNAKLRKSHNNIFRFLLKVLVGVRNGCDGLVTRRHAAPPSRSSRCPTLVRHCCDEWVAPALHRAVLFHPFRPE
ncbi:MAG: hypothetical protein O2955_14985 [Planctomycetota bacterium]|nr:hypothetical protein [Planctomycetota bacterium]